MSMTSNLQGQAAGRQRSLSLFQPLSWLQRGWGDLWQHPMASLTYGLIVSGMGVLLVSMARHPYFLAAVISGFMLVGPVLTTGLCEMSRRRERGEAADFGTSLDGLTRNTPALGNFALTLLILSAVWFMLSSFMLFQVLGNVAPDYGTTVWSMWDEMMEMMTADQMLSYLVVGGSLAVVVFAVSVVTVPMIIDRDVSAGFAMRSSLRQTLMHLPTMVIWALLIAGLVAIGFMTFLAGMVLVFPLLGHATWHAYQDLES